uniref:hypothetical protein n=1 Tax=Candidatus Scatousia sp. TaxID=3085663 RepID=UPI00402724A9
MAGEGTTLTDAQLAARKNHYLEQVGRAKPKANGTKNNPLKGEDLALMLKERFNHKKDNSKKSNAEAIAELNAKEEAKKTASKGQSKSLTYNEAHRVENNIPQEQVDKLNKLKAQLEAEEAASKKVQSAKSDIPAADASKSQAEPKTWKKYLAEHGKEYKQPVSGVVEADRRTAEAIKKNAEAKEALKQDALRNAEKINKKFTISAAQIDKQFGLTDLKPVDADYAKDYERILDEREKGTLEQGAKNEARQGAKPDAKAGVVAQPAPEVKSDAKAGVVAQPAPEVKPDAKAGVVAQPAPEVNPEARQGAKSDVKAGAISQPEPQVKPETRAAVNPEPKPAAVAEGKQELPKKSGILGKIGKFFKSKGGKIALAAGAIALVAGLFKMCSGKKDEPVPPTPVPPAPTEATQPTLPAEPQFALDVEEGQMPKSYTIQAGNYPSGIIMDTYGVAFGTPEYEQIRDAVYEASGYERNTNLKAGDKFTLPDVTVGDKVYTANENADVRKGEIADNGLKLGRTKEVVKANDKYYIVDQKTGERVEGEGPFESKDDALARLDELNA